MVSIPPQEAGDPVLGLLRNALGSSGRLSWIGYLSTVGVYGNSKSRRALVRLSNGKRQMVTVGDTIDGGKVAAIGKSELRYIKGGKNITLKVPQG